MGLDMFLIRRKKNVKDFDNWYRDGDEIMYWRKVNSIHRWFVENVQKGVDDCGYYKVEKEQLESLHDICGEILDRVIMAPSKITNGYSIEKKEDGSFEKIYNYIDGMIATNPEVCEELLPTQEGFFFGSTEYNNWYMEDVKRTYYELGILLKLYDFNNYDIYYSSSW